jgi:hypothetical protein
MKRLLLLPIVVFGVAEACSLNPQPFPPETFDASSDVAKVSLDSGGGGVDAETNPGPMGDAASDAPSDGATNFTDGAVDGATDAADDASDAGDAGDAPND